MSQLHTSRLLLRPLLIEDARELFSYRSDPEIRRFQSWRPETIADAEDFITHRIAAIPDLPDTWYQLAICKTSSTELIGDCGLHFLRSDHGQVEIGITLKREYQGMGYATESLEAVFNYLFNGLHKHRLTASVDPGNIASVRLLERMKMRKEAHFIESIRDGERWLDDVVYAILAHEWETYRQETPDE